MQGQCVTWYIPFTVFDGAGTHCALSRMVLLINALAYRPLSAFKTVNQWHFTNRVSQKTGPKTHDHNSVKSLPIY